MPGLPHTANALHTGEREMVARQIQGGIFRTTRPSPATLKPSIEAKQPAEQEALAMNFRLQKATQEAESKRIEVVRDFQPIVAPASTPVAS